MTDFYVFQFVPLVLVEAVALRLVKWGSFPRSLFDSLLMNAATFLGLMLNLSPRIYTYGPIGLTLFCVYSTIVEGVVLTLMEPHEPGKIWLSAVTANAAGGVLLAALALYLTFVNPQAAPKTGAAPPAAAHTI